MARMIVAKWSSHALPQQREVLAAHRIASFDRVGLAVDLVQAAAASNDIERVAVFMAKDAGV